MSRLGFLAWALCCSCAVTPQAAAPAPPVTPTKSEWTTQLDREHTLVGKVWDVRQSKLVEPASCFAELAKARFVLLGERHDNPDHHRLQARALQALVDAKRKPAVVFEMLEVERQPDIDRYRAEATATSAGFGAALQWEKSSWPPFAEYQAIFDVAFAAGLRITAGNLAHTAARALVKQGPGALPDAKRQELRLDQAFPPQLEAPLIEELRASHCGHLPEQLLGPMALAQHARDAQMARALLDAGENGAVLIAGSGHARLDRGVPYYLALEAPNATVASVALVEVQHERTDAPAYAESAGPFHYLWFTPRLTDEDPCAAFKK